MKPPIPPTMWANRQVKWMNSQLRQQIIALLEAYRSAHLAVAGPDGPWATVVPFLGDDLTLFLVETRASDLVYYVENRPEVVLTVGETEAGGHLQLFATAQVLTAAELGATPPAVQDAYGHRSRRAPGIYAVLRVMPTRIRHYSPAGGLTQRQTLDVEPTNR